MLLLAVPLGGVLIAGVATLASAAVPFSASASVSAPAQYLGDSAGTTFTFIVKNTGTSTPIGAVEITRPATSWAVMSCPTGPAGWVRTVSATNCRYTSAATVADDILPGASRTLTLKASTAHGRNNRMGEWKVRVSKTRSFATAADLTAATASATNALRTTVYTWQVTAATVAGTPTLGACPTLVKSAHAGSSRAIVVCAKNHAYTRLTPVAASSYLSGTFIKTRGAFSASNAPARSGSFAVASWSPTRVSTTVGGGKTVVARVGSAANETSPLVTLTGYAATNTPPVAANDTFSATEDVPRTGNVLSNDTDADGDPLTAVPSVAPAHGTLSLAASGAFTYTPAANFHGTDTFRYRASDGFTTSLQGVVTITVDQVNDAPAATSGAVNVTEDTARQIPLRGTDVDVQPLSFEIVTGPTHGSLGTIAAPTCAGTGCTAPATYTPDGNYTGADSFTYRVNDGTVDSNLATVSITVSAVNDAPVAVNDAYSTDEDTPLTVVAPGVLANDTDAESSPLTAALVTGPAHGTLTLNADGSFTYTPSAGYNGSDAFTYQAHDGSVDSNVATVSLTVNAVADTPVANDDVATLSENASGTAVNVLANDTDGDGDPLAVSAVDTTGTSGTVTNNGTDITYDPNGQFEYLGDGQTATDTFTYTVSDGNGGTDTATVTITIQGDNDAPVAVNDAYSTDEDTPLTVVAPGVLANDTDAEGSPLTAVLVGSPAHGSVTLQPDGSFTYTPAANYNGSDSFTYAATDGSTLSNVATVSLTISPVADAPVANDDAATVGEDSSGATVNVLANDTDGDGDPLAVSAVDTTGTSGTVTNNGTDVTYDPNGQFEYLAADETATDTFTYTVSDGAGGTDTATVTITVQGANDAPVAVDDAYQTLQDTPLTVPAPGVLANDTDADTSDPLTAGNASDPANGSVTLNPNGSFTYTPDTGYTGSDSFTYDASDGTASDTATVTLTVVPPNATPTADATSASGNEDGGAMTVTLTGHDDDGDALTFTAGTATNGLVTVPTGVSCDSNTPSTCTATVTYTPNADFFGSDSFTYTANDGTTDSAPATASVTVTAVNDAPSFTKGADQTVLEDAGAQTVNGWATAISAGPANESGQTVTFEVTENSNAALFSVLPAVGSTGDLTYTPAVNANGSATITLRAQDDGGTANGGVDASPTQQFTITVTAVNDAPSFTKGADQTVLEDTGAYSVSNWATAISKGPADESAQSLSFTTSNDNNALFSTQPGVSPTGTLVYTPAPNAVGSATVTVSLSDNGGTANGGDDTSDAQTFTVTVSGVNDEPSFTHDGDQTVLEDSGSQSVPGFVNSTSAGPADESAQTVTVSVTNVTNPTLFLLAPSISSTGTLSYWPNGNANGTSTITARAVDDGGTANGGDDTGPDMTFTITVTAVNDVPSFTKGSDQTLGEDAGAISVSNWATAISQGPANESGQTVTFNVGNDNTALFSTQPIVTPSGTLQYTSAPNKYGAATVTVSISDNGGTANGGVDTSAAQTFVITVSAVNDAPVAAAKAFTVQANMKISLGGLLTGATDPNDSPVPAGQPAYSPSFTVGSITPGADCTDCTVSNIDTAAGTFDFDPPPGGTGTYTVTYTVVDSGYPAPGATSAPATITFTVNGPVIWFANASVAGPGTGRLSDPFKTIASVNAVDAPGHRIFLAPGTYADAITLTSSEWLTGAAAKAASFDTLMGITPPAGTIARPAINTTAPVLNGSVTLGTGNTVRGLTLSGSPALTATSFGTLTLGSGANADLSLDSAGQALSLSTGTISGDFLSTLSDGGTNNVLLNAVSSTGTSLGTGTLQLATNEGFKIAGGDGTFSYAGQVLNAVGADVSIANKTAGTISLSGAISDATGAGVSLLNNDGAIVNLTGGVTLTSGASNAFVATDGGTVSVTGAANTLSSTTGAALIVTDTTIGAADLTFRTISAQDPTIDAGTYGIHLSNTGTAGNLNVTGTGSAATGGTIQGKSTGIKLNITSAPSFSWMKLTNHGDFAIKGDTVTGFSLISSVIDGSVGPNGNDANANEGAVSFDELLGTGVVITNSVIKDGVSNDLRVRNDSGTLNRLTITGTTFGSTAATHNDSIQLEGNGSGALNATIQSSTFASARGDHIQASIQGTGAGDIVITGNALSNSHPTSLGGQIVLGASASGDMTYAVNNNTINGSVGTAIVTTATFASGMSTSTAVGTISGNTIGTSGVAGSGSSAASGIDVSVIGNGRNSVQILNNTIRQTSQHGIIAFAGGASRNTTGVDNSGDLNLTVAGNLVEQPFNTGSSSSGFQLNAGTNSDGGPDRYDVCLGFSNNDFASGGEDLSSNSRDYVLLQGFETFVRMPGWTGPATSQDASFPAALQSYLDARDTGAAPLTTFGRTNPTDFDAAIVDGFYNTAGGAACSTS